MAERPTSVQRLAGRLSSLLRVLDAGREHSTAEVDSSAPPARGEGDVRRPGDIVDRYVIESLLGRGGMGQVYAARDQRLGRHVALKLVEGDRDGSARARALREARAASAFEHPNAVVVFDVGEAGSVTFLAMELIQGATLRSLVGQANPFERRLRWLVEIARALAAAHRAGLVHRDVKPDNVMIREDGVVKVLDFGIARRRQTNVDPSTPGADIGATVTAEGVVIGTPLYLAPEQLRSEDVDGRVDQFAWGVTAYELLAGRVPWKGGDNLALVSQILSARVASLRDDDPSIPEEVDRAVLRTLANDREARFATMDDVADAIEPFAERAVTRAEQAAAAAVASNAPTQQDPQRTSARAAIAATLAVAPARKRWWAAGAIAAIAAGLVAAGVVLRERARAGPAPSAAPVAASVVAAGVACSPAELSGGDTSDSLARAIGFGACARLATELGVDWGGSSRGAGLGVRATVDARSTVVAISLAGRDAEGKGATPVEAVDAAVAAMVTRVAAPEPTPEQIAALGATDAAGARRVARVWRRVDYRLAADPEAELRRAVEEVPGSPWPYLLLANQATESSESMRSSIENTLARLERLPTSRADAVRGFLTLLGPSASVSEGLSLSRRAFMAAPDDADVGVLHAVSLARAGPRDEAIAALSRLMTAFPSRSIPAVRQALYYLDAKIDLADTLRLHEHLRGVLPEAQGWHQSVTALLAIERLQDAEAGLDVARRFGTDRADPRARFARADVALASFRPAEARAIGAAALAEPHPKWSMYGAAYVVASYLMEGRLAEAQSAQLAEIERQRGASNPLRAVEHANHDMKLRRWLGQAPPRKDYLDWLDAALANVEDTMPYAHIVRRRAELGLARMRGNQARAKSLGTAALADLERRIEERAGGDRTKRDTALVATLALVRAVRGDPAGAKLWRAAEHASDYERRGSALDAALALDAIGDRAGARRAYELARHPAPLPWDAASLLLAEVRLAALDRAEGLEASATARDARIARAWTAPDKGFREAILSMR